MSERNSRGLKVLVGSQWGGLEWKWVRNSRGFKVQEGPQWAGLEWKWVK